MQLVRGTFVTLAIAAILGTTSCSELTNPCPVESFDNDKFLDGVWGLTTINGAPIPPQGYAAEGGNYIKAGSIEFKTRRVTGECKDADEMAGIAIIRYANVDVNGKPKPSRTYALAFDYVVKTGIVTLSFGEAMQETTRSGNQLTVPQSENNSAKPTSAVFVR